MNSSPAWPPLLPGTPQGELAAALRDVVAVTSWTGDPAKGSPKRVAIVGMLFTDPDDERKMRAAVYTGFERVLEVVEGSAWWHDRHPVLEVTGDVHVTDPAHRAGFHAPAAPETRHLCAGHGRVRLWLSPQTACVPCAGRGQP